MAEQERRAHPRKLVSTAVTFHDSIGGVDLRGWLHDISRGGCFVATPSLLTFGEDIDISLTLPYPRVVISGKARVVWVRETNDREAPAGMGVQFGDLAPEMVAAIDKLAAGERLARPKTVIGLAPPAPGSSPSYSDVRIELPKIEEKPAPPPEPVAELVPDPVVEPIAEPAPITSPLAPIERPEPRKRGRERWLIAGAAAVSVLGLVALGVFWGRGDRVPTPQADAAPVAEILDASEPAIEDATAALPAIVDASPDVHAREAGAGGGKKKHRRRKRH